MSDARIVLLAALAPEIGNRRAESIGAGQIDGDGDFKSSVQHFADSIPLRHIGQPDDAAAAVAFLASDEARHVTGVDWLIDGGQTLQSWANAPAGDAFPKYR